MNLNSIWSALEESYNRFNGISYEGSLSAIAELNLPSNWFIWLVAIMFFGDEPISSVEFMRALPYGWQDALEERFASAARQGYLAGDGAGGYRPTEKGTDAVRRMVQADSDVVSPLRPIPEADAARLLSYLSRIADASLTAPEPTSKFIISHKRKHMHPGRGASVNVLTVQTLNELEGFRTDAHNAAWMAHNVAGHAWDAFSHLWRNGASTLDQMYETLQYNEVPKEVYAADLLGLAKQGWVREEAGTYRVTEAGRKIREEAEALTDKYFFAPWACLNESELDELANLAGQLRDGTPRVIRRK
ncbi:MAG: hypothetical protein QY302_11380 [Anaerolineales bacterium]|nr:MAG: hypothetical protein QY302_11380 [Anaerolineales bacterium]